MSNVPCQHLRASWIELVSFPCFREECLQTARAMALKWEAACHRSCKPTLWDPMNLGSNQTLSIIQTSHSNFPQLSSTSLTTRVAEEMEWGKGLTRCLGSNGCLGEAARPPSLPCPSFHIPSCLLFLFHSPPDPSAHVSLLVGLVVPGERKRLSHHNNHPKSLWSGLYSLRLTYTHHRI